MSQVWQPLSGILGFEPVVLTPAPGLYTAPPAFRVRGSCVVHDIGTLLL